MKFHGFFAQNKCFKAFAIIVASTSLMGEEVDKFMIPNETHFAAAIQGKDCSIYRVLVKRANEELEENNQRLKTYMEFAIQKREALRLCLKDKGILLSEETLETLAAEVCPVEYDEWLSPGYRVHMAKQDISATAETLRKVSRLLKWHCRALPMQPVPAAATGSP